MAYETNIFINVGTLSTCHMLQICYVYTLANLDDSLVSRVEWGFKNSKIDNLRARTTTRTHKMFSKLKWKSL